jgi:hypothetical protein
VTFKHFFYNSKNNKQEIFESVFEYYYTKGYFGKIDKKVIKESQQKWFTKLVFLLESNDQDSLNLILSNRDNTCTREYFGRIYGENILESSRNEIEEIVKKALK